MGLWNKQTPSIEILLLVKLVKGQKEIMASLQNVTDAITKLGTDVSAEVQAAKDAILAAQNGNPAALDAVVASLDTIDKAVNDAAASFVPPVAPAA